MSEDDDEQDLPRPSRTPEPPRVRKPSTTQTITPPRARRHRAKSVHIPSQPSGVDRSFYLPHYSTDQQYSLKQGDLNLELGLGDDFDVSFGEAIRRGVEGEEMPLSREALRVLSEAKDNLDLRMMGKQGRKGSIGMGLFRESRAAAVAAIAKGMRRDEVVEEVSPLTAIPPPAVPKISRGTPSSRSRDALEEDGMEAAIITGIRVSSSRSSTDRLSPRPSRHNFREELVSPVEDESGWTTTSSGEFSASIEDQRAQQDLRDELDETEVDTDEDERMTVPLQPFDHAVGGHSSIYKFTRRAVCKVSHCVFCRAVPLFSNWTSRLGHLPLSPSPRPVPY